MNHRELEHHLQNLFDGRLEGQAFEDLQQELRDNPAARKAYREHLHLHQALKFRSKGVDMLNVVPMDLVVKRRERRLLRTSALAAAAVVAMGAMVMALIAARKPQPTLTFNTAPGTDIGISHALTGEDAPNGFVLEPGSRLKVLNGTVELEFASGVRGIVRGPADMTLQREDLLDLASGTVWFEVPAKAVGFKVNTPDLVLTDLGTEFGIISEPNFLDEVHVFDGKVEVCSRHGLKKKELLKAGQARYAGPAGRWKETPVRRDHFLAELPTKKIEPAVISTEDSSTSQLAYADDASASDLLHGLTPVTTGWNLGNNADPKELTDGIHGAGFGQVPGDPVQGAWTTVGATTEYHLGKGSKGLGYDITSILSIADWNGAGFGNQAWTVEVKPVGGDYRILHTVNHHPLSSQPLDGGGATKVVLTDKSGILASGIESIKFTASHVAGSVGNSFVWRELDVFGTPTERAPSR
jgi:ferric-dicitrate binding protein FerR (iron transport regulator)